MRSAIRTHPIRIPTHSDPIVSQPELPIRHVIAPRRGRYGEIEKFATYMIRDGGKTAPHKGYGFVVFKTEAAADAAFDAINGTEWSAPIEICGQVSQPSPFPPQSFAPPLHPILTHSRPIPAPFPPLTPRPIPATRPLRSIWINLALTAPLMRHQR